MSGYQLEIWCDSVRIENGRLGFFSFFLLVSFFFSIYLYFLFIEPRARVRVMTVMLSHTSVTPDGLVTVTVTSHGIYRRI